MSLEEYFDIDCPKCGHSQETLVWKSINVDLDPELREKLFEGEINLFRCEKCEASGDIPMDLMYHDMTKKFCVQYYHPEKLKSIDSFRIFKTNGKVDGQLIGLPKGNKDGIYMTEPHVCFSMVEMIQYIHFRELLYLREIKPD